MYLCVSKLPSTFAGPIHKRVRTASHCTQRCRAVAQHGLRQPLFLHLSTHINCHEFYLNDGCFGARSNCSRVCTRPQQTARRKRSSYSFCTQSASPAVASAYVRVYQTIANNSSGSCVRLARYYLDTSARNDCHLYLPLECFLDAAVVIGGGISTPAGLPLSALGESHESAGV